MRSAREDKDTVLAKRIRDLFITNSGDSENEEEITRDIFEMKAESGAMQDYFKQINVEVSQARQLFDLLDADGSGSVSSTEIIEGCLRLRGPAQSLDLCLLIRDVDLLHKAVHVMIEHLKSHGVASGPPSVKDEN